ncbi:DUF1351 domain-containing protein [Lactobacillus johnsonii]|uniref:Lj965 prophage protein n=1 Tax=Lactobacillus johnsonii (strain CNCM I-12250 / La1 / NCC 533) TaxID=257314 RepID=Q65PV5_LACJO|nr:DUF1351 domain-containing protein [Lactobacillus johnsonii]NP_958569.1 DUF1351 domain-containing protein [Lactobacillus prophage Lj965]AAR27446.1 putative protein [Lactobacillus prophage Lj965]AAS08284.1 Lj965 prophage protein [Lactobacillus prophage Lj965] [Lactobacillus johnsonii NCC 533]MCT3322054.1 DUF1351 domain-containing protein [Lactobacillus johnsonii]MCT3341041.1 DUF1351 domain-containing protein [Lactobacillus johnsonii]MCT3389249.1 DUF1351 domain-containing protein [Lactobacill
MRTTVTKELIKFDNEELPINLEPAKIYFPKYEELKKRVDRLTDSLKDYVVTEDSYEQDKKVRAELNRIQKMLSKKRIEIFNEAVEPANEFKQHVSGLEKQIKCASDRISEGIKHYTDKEKDAKFQETKLRLGKLALKYNVSIRLLGDIREKDNQFNHWLNKSCSWKRIETEAENFFKSEAEKATAKADAQKVIINKANNPLFKSALPISPYLEMLDYKSLPDVLNQMDNDLESVKKQKKQQKKAMQDIKKHGDQYIDTNTGEVVDTVHSMTIKFSGTIEQFKALLQYAESNNISYERVK